MHKPLLESYIAGVRDTDHGENYPALFNYFWPEFITAFILSSLLYLIDGMFIAHLKSTSMYATLGVTSTLIHFITKIAEGLSVGTMVLCGQWNGVGEHQKVGKVAVSGVWLTVIVGACISSLLFWAAPAIYMWYEVPPKMVAMGTMFLRLRALSIFFSFVFFALIGFLRGVKNTRVPMKIFMIGAAVFIVADYALIFGKWGFPELKLYGSAVASIVQYTIMLAIGAWYVMRDMGAKYSTSLMESGDISWVKSIIALSWPVMIDKAILAAAKMWLAKLIGPLGKTALASFTVIKDIEQLAFVPAIACAQVVTFLVSNDYQRHDWLGIKNNIKRILLMASVMVFAILAFFSYAPHTIIQYFDTKHHFGDFAAAALPILSVLVFFDLLQLILAGALRGASDVKTVMLVRLVTGLVLFCPLSYALAHLAIENTLVKFIVVYGSFYVCNGLMSLVYIYRFRTNGWKKHARFTTSKKAAFDDVSLPDNDQSQIESAL